MNVEQATALLVARYLVRRAKEGVFGILVRNLPPFDIPQFLNIFREARISGTSFRLGLIGYDESLPSDHAVVGTTEIAEVVEWRNTTLDPKIVIVRENAPLLHSLNQFEHLKGEKLYRLVADEAGQTLGLPLLWNVLKRPRIRAFIPLEGLLSYYTALLNTDEKQRRFEVGRTLYFLGLLEDPDLSEELAPAKIADRLEQNRFNVTRVARMNPVDRQRLTRALRLPSDLADTYERAMEFYRRPQETNLKGLTLENVKKLWELPEIPLPVDTPATLAEEVPVFDAPPPAVVTSPTRELSATRARETMELLLDDNTEERDEILYTYFEQLREHDKEVQENPNTETLYQTQELFERTVTENYWGGILRLIPPQSEEESEITTLGKGQVPQRLRELYAYEFIPFTPSSSDRPEWQLVDRLKRLVDEFGLDRDALNAFDQIDVARRIFLLVIDQLIRYPFLTLNSYLPVDELEETLRTKAGDLGLFKSDGSRISLLRCGQLYLKAYNDLLRILHQEYGDIAKIAPFGIEQLCSTILVLDTIIFEQSDQYQALLSPLHPLHLWKYIELSTQTLAAGTMLSKSDQSLLKEQVDSLPNPVTTIYLRRLTEIKYTEGNRCDKLRA